MRLRILLEPRYGASYQQILAMAQATEEAGFDAFFRSDHYLGIDAGDASYAPTDSWATLAGLAVQTRRVRLPPSRAAGHHRRHRARDERRPGRTGHRGGLVRA